MVDGVAKGRVDVLPRGSPTEQRSGEDGEQVAVPDEPVPPWRVGRRRTGHHHAHVRVESLEMGPVRKAVLFTQGGALLCGVSLMVREEGRLHHKRTCTKVTKTITHTQRIKHKT